MKFTYRIAAVVLAAVLSIGSIVTSISSAHAVQVVQVAAQDSLNTALTGLESMEALPEAASPTSTECGYPNVRHVRTKTVASGTVTVKIYKEVGHEVFVYKITKKSLSDVHKMTLRVNFSPQGKYNYNFARSTFGARICVGVPVTGTRMLTVDLQVGKRYQGRIHTVAVG